MTSIISPFLLCICTALLPPLFCCHPLCLPVSNHLHLYLHPSVCLSIIFFSIHLSFFQNPLSFIRLFQLTCLFRISSPPQIYQNHFKLSSSPLFCPFDFDDGLPLWGPCMFRFPSLVTAFCLVLEALRWDPARWRPSVSRSDRAECGCNTGSGHWHWHSLVSGYGSATTQPAFTLRLETVWLFICRHLAKTLKMNWGLVQAWGESIQDKQIVPVLIWSSLPFILLPPFSVSTSLTFTPGKKYLKNKVLHTDTVSVLPSFAIRLAGQKSVKLLTAWWTKSVFLC